MKAEDFSPGDELVHDDGTRSEYTVIATDKSTDVITAEYNGAGFKAAFAYPASQWASMGFKRKGASLPASSQLQPFYGQGIMNWLPQKQQSKLPWLNTTPPVIQVAAPAPVEMSTPARRKQVSHNGKDWVDYRHLLDADDFESYTHRREI